MRKVDEARALQKHYEDKVGRGLDRLTDGQKKNMRSLCFLVAVFNGFFLNRG